MVKQQHHQWWEFVFAKDPYIMVGGIIPEIDNNNYKVGSSEYFITEADESDNSFILKS